MIYQELRRLAASMLAREPAGQTLEATALVHEAYVRLVDSDAEQTWNHDGAPLVFVIGPDRQVQAQALDAGGRFSGG